MRKGCSLISWAHSLLPSHQNQEIFAKVACAVSDSYSMVFLTLVMRSGASLGQVWSEDHIPSLPLCSPYLPCETLETELAVSGHGHFQLQDSILGWMHSNLHV